MQEWLRISLILSCFGFLREFRPSEPFVTEFLSGEWRDITPEQLYQDVYPIGTYSTLGLLFIVFLITDILRYKPIIIVSACAGIIIWSLLLWTESLWALQLVQVFYGFYMAAEVGYYTYMYAKVDKINYQKVTGNARAAILSGRFIASVIAQLLVSFEVMNLRDLNYLTLGSQTLSLVVGILLPSVGISLYFYSVPKTTVKDSDDKELTVNGSNEKETTEKGSDDKDQQDTTLSENDMKPKFSFSRAYKLLWRHFIDSYSNPKIIQWSFWWSLAMAGFLMVQYYVQFLWQVIDEDRAVLLNAGVEAALTMFGAIAAFLAGFMTSKTFQKYDLWILTLCSLLEGVFIVISALTTSIWLAYSMYVLFGILYAFMITIASATVAKHLADDSFALIFGINTLLALVFQSILTAIILTWLALEPRDQFLVYGLYFVGLSLIYLVTSVVKLIFCRNV